MLEQGLWRETIKEELLLDEFWNFYYCKRVRKEDQILPVITIYVKLLYKV